MKAWLQRWLNIKPSLTTASDAAALLLEAKNAHISDLRVLIDKAQEREAELAAMVKLALDHQFYRPTISGKPSENKLTPLIPSEHLSDVAVFDPEEDAAEMKKQQDTLAELMREQNTAGMHKVSA